MKDNLKQFVEQHRKEFDTAVPNDLWLGIASQLPRKTVINLKTLGRMLKYGFSASALVVGTFLVLHSQKEQRLTAQQKSDVKPSMENVPANSNPTASAITNTNWKSSVVKAQKFSVPLSQQDSLPPISVNNLPEPQRQGSDQIQGLPPYNMVVVSSGVFERKVKFEDSTQSSYGVKIDTLFNGVATLEIVSEDCQINIITGSSDHLAINGKVGFAMGNIRCLGLRCYMNKISNCRYEKRDSVLKVWVESTSLGEWVKMTKQDKERSELNFTVPKWVEVNVKNESGNIVVSGLETSPIYLRTEYGHISASNTVSDLFLNSKSGNILVKNHRGPVEATSSYGNQFLEDVQGQVSLHSASGHINVKGLNGDLQLNSSYGNQQLQNIKGKIQSVLSSGNLTVTDIKGNIQAKSSYGKQSYTNIDGDISAQTSSGNITLNNCKGGLGIGTSFGNISGKNILLLNNSDFKTSSGNISMELLNNMSDLHFDLTASSGRMLVEKNGVKNVAENSLNLGAGAIHVKGVSSYGNQTYR